MSDYDTIRHFADSYGLLAMLLVFLLFTLWVFRPGARRHYHGAATMIFDEENDATASNKDEIHG